MFGTFSARVLRVIAAMALASVPVVSFAAPTETVQFRYWSFWVAEGGDWTLAQMAPEERQLSDMAVDGWHFGVWGDDGGQPPRSLPNFASLCPTLAAATPSPKVTRVAVVLDPGVGADAPTGEVPGAIRTACLSLPGKVFSSSALKAAAKDVRIENSQLCAIDGYPRTECKPQIGGPTPSFTGSLPSESTSSPSADESASTNEATQRSSWAKVSPILLGVLGSLLLVGGAALAISQRPRR